jgi:hypothetical protein
MRQKLCPALRLALHKPVSGAGFQPALDLFLDLALAASTVYQGLSLSSISQRIQQFGRVSYRKTFP